MDESSHNLPVGVPPLGGINTAATGPAGCHASGHNLGGGGGRKHASRTLTRPIASSPLSSFRHWSLGFVSSFIICHSSFALSALVLSLDQTPATSAPAPPPPPPQYPTGDWWGFRNTLANHGLTIGGLVQFDVTKNLRGGADTDKTPTRYLLDLSATYDASKFLPDATLFLDFQSHDGPDGSKTVGDIQGFDNLDGPHFVQIYQLWYQQLLFDKQLRIKAGKIDINNTDFSIIEHGTEFLQSSATYAVTNYPFVTYPDPAPGAEFFFTAPNNLYAGFGAFYSNSQQNVLDFVGHPQSVELTSGGSYLITEVGNRWTLHANNSDLPGHAAIGAWYHTGESPKLTDPSTEIRGTPGAYLFADQTLYTQNAAQNHPKQDLGAFISFGLASPRTIPIQQNLAAGITATGFIHSRPNDIVGLLTTWAHLSPTTSPTPHHDETAFELFYKLQLTTWASLKPDLQYIISPSGKYPDALAFTLRAEIDF